MAVQDLIAETIAQHITQPKVISYAPTKLNEVQGRFVASNRVYNFILNKDGVSYSPAGQGDSLLFSALYLQRLDTVRKPKVGSDRCNAGKSYQCGRICLGNRRKCHKGVRDVNDARRIASILESTNEQLKNKVGSEVSAKAKARGEALFGARENRAKNGKPERVKVEVKPVIKSIADIPNIPESAKTWVKSVENLATPELVAIAGKVGFPEITTEKSGTASAFYRRSANTVSMGTHVTEDTRSKVVFLHEYGHYIDSNLPSLRGHVSNSDEAINARKSDEKLLKKASKVNILPKQIILASKASVNEFLESSKKLLDINIPEQSQDIGESAKADIKKLAEKTEPITFNEARSLGNSANFLAQYHPDVLASPMGQITQLDADIRGMVADLFGAITKNKVGYGHANSYYNQRSNFNNYLQGTEAFANIIAIANSGDEKAIAVAKKFAPNMWKFVMDSIKV
jgi:hypothetical protein